MTRTSDEPALMLKRGDESAHCKRLGRWLRASIVLNVLLLAAVAGIVAGYSSSTGLVAPSASPDLSGGER